MHRRGRKPGLRQTFEKPGGRRIGDGGQGREIRQILHPGQLLVQGDLFGDEQHLASRRDRVAGDLDAVNRGEA